MTDRFACEVCNFSVESDDQQELIEMVQQHAEEQHDKELSPEQVRDSIQSPQTA